ncbi:MAG: hypothetical protein ACSHXZ_07160, partial [Gammaproteobacteria bacterium]
KHPPLLLNLYFLKNFFPEPSWLGGGVLYALFAAWQALIVIISQSFELSVDRSLPPLHLLSQGRALCHTKLIWQLEFELFTN